MVAIALGIDPAVAEFVDGEAPWVATVLGGDRAGFVLAIRVTRAAELRALLTTGSESRFRAVSAAGLLVLEPRRSGSDVRLALAGDCLLVARDIATLEMAGRFTASAPAEATSEDAELVLERTLSTLLAPSVAAAWTELRARLEAAELAARAQHADRRADLADPRAAIELLAGTATAAANTLQDVTRARVALSFERRLSIRVEASLKPGSSSASALTSVGAVPPEALTLDPAEPLWISIPWGDLHVGARAGRALGDLLGDRLRESERGDGIAAGEALDAAVPGTVRFAWLDGDAGARALGFEVRAASDEVAFAQAMRRSARVLSVKPVSDLLGRFRELPRSGRARVSRKAERQLEVRDASGSLVSVAWEPTVGGIRGVVALDGAKEHLAAWPRSPERRPGPTEVALGLGESTHLLAAAGRVSGGAAGGPGGWIVLSAGHEAGEVRARVAIEPSALRVLAAWTE